ncbi:MAG: hypothetical protein F6K42_12355 [Leptolyngbya sp. SIO1D8]|nr:hypothetical protein [Leptolyngbya sp. SIO1D8]
MVSQPNHKTEKSILSPPASTATDVDAESRSLGRVLKAALLYFAMVFAVGCLLGPIRVLWLVPYFGERGAWI